MTRQTFIIQPSPHPARSHALEAVRNAPEGMVIEIKPRTRTLDANAAMWPMLDALSKQTDWHGIRLSPDEWKDLLSAGLVKSKVVPNMDGTGFVILGQRTSKMSRSEFSDLLELIHSFAAERGIEL